MTYYTTTLWDLHQKPDLKIKNITFIPKNLAKFNYIFFHDLEWQHAITCILVHLYLNMGPTSKTRH